MRAATSSVTKVAANIWKILITFEDLLTLPRRFTFLRIIFTTSASKMKARKISLC